MPRVVVPRPSIVVLLALSLLAVAASAESRNAAPSVKVWVPASVDFAPWLQGQPHHELVVNAEGSLFRIERALFDSLPVTLRDQLRVRLDTIELPTRIFDTYRESLPPSVSTGEPLVWLVQPFLKLPPRWRDRALETSGIRRAHLVWIEEAEERSDLEASVFRPDLSSQPNAIAPPGAVQYAAPLNELLKIDERLPATGASVRVSIQGLRTAERAQLASEIAALSATTPIEYAQIDRIDWRARFDRSAAVRIAQHQEVLWVMVDDDSWPCPTRSHSTHSVITRRRDLEPLVPEFDPEDPAVELIFRDFSSLTMRIERQLLDKTIFQPYRGMSRLVSDRVGPPCRLTSEYRGFHPGALDEAPPGVVPPLIEGGSFQYLLYLNDSQQVPLDWQDRVEQLGVRRAMFPSSGRQVVWADESARDALADLVAPRGLFSVTNASDPPRFLRASGDWASGLRIDPALLALARASGQFHFVDVRIVRTGRLAATQSRVEDLSPAPVQARGSLEMKQLWTWLDVAGLRELAERPDVFSIDVRSGGTSAAAVRSDTWLVHAPPGLLDSELPGVQWLGTYGGGEVLRLADAALTLLPLSIRSQLGLYSDLVTPNGLVGFDAYDELPWIPSGSEFVPSGGSDLYWFLPQPPGRDGAEQWMSAVEGTGAFIVVPPMDDSWFIFSSMNPAGILAATPVAAARLGGLIAPRSDADAPEDMAFPLHSLGELHPYFRAPPWHFGVLEDDFPFGEETRLLVVRTARVLDQQDGAGARVDTLIERYLVEYEEGVNGEERFFEGEVLSGEWHEAVDRLIHEPSVIWAGDYIPATGGPAGGPPGDDSSPGFDPNTGTAISIPLLGGQTMVLLGLLLGLVAMRRLYIVRSSRAP